jgi:DNA polymerase-3 subunit delta'
LDWPVVGHEFAVNLLQQAVATEQLSHAYLLSGPPQVGKTTVALACAQARLCTDPDPPCGECIACSKVLRGVHPDLHVISPVTSNLLIDQVRDLLRQVSLSPVEARHRIFVLRRIERATVPAANALLKTLEEPPEHVVLFLTLTEGEQTLPTVRSRCQQLALRPLPADLIAQALQDRWQVSPQHAALLARLSLGRLGWAVTMLGKSSTWQQRAQILDDLQDLRTQGRVERLRYAERLSQRELEDALDVLHLWSTWWRDIMLLQLGCEGHVANIDCMDTLRDESGRYRDRQTRAFVQMLTVTSRYLQQNANPRLALEHLVLHLPRPA